MKRIDVINRAGRNLRQAKLRTFLTALAISVGAFTITLALAAGTGAQDYTSNLIKNNGDPRSLSVFTKSNESKQSGPQKYDAGSGQSAQAGFLATKDINRIAKVAGIEKVTPMYSVTADYMVGPNATKYDTSVMIKGDQTSMDLVAGSLDNFQPSQGKAVISEDYVKPLGYANAQAAIGQKITIHVTKQTTDPAQAASKDISFIIQAVDQKNTTTLSYQDGIRINPGDGEAIYNYEKPVGAPDEYIGVTAYAAKNADTATVQKAIEHLGYQVFSVQDVQKTLFTFVNVVMGGVAGFGALAILASIFGIINTQYISVLERTQQIGLMKALGARRKDIGRLFRYEAAWVGFLGGVIGTGLALLVGLLNPTITKALDLEKGTDLLMFKPLYSVILILALMLVAVLAGYFPSRKAAKLDPIEALRTE